MHAPRGTCSANVLAARLAVVRETAMCFCQVTFLPPPKKEVMFSVRSVCLSVRRITRKLVNGF